MKANELMIWDWVLMDIYCPPTGLLRPLKVTPQDLLWITQGKKCEPIPLTAEILEQNAYPDDGCWYSFGDFYVAQYGDCYVIHQNPDDDKRDFLCRIHFVHELQHILRLCGLNDLADNFKV